MALTGIALMGYVLAHMVGNLKMYLGRAEFDAYAHALRELLHPILPNHVVLWALRVGLILAFVLHIHAAYSLTRMNQRSRPVKYQSPRDYIAVSFASRTMRWTGVIILLYVLFHLADLTWGWANPDFVRGAAYDNLVASFERWPVALVYVVANIALGIHLFHGGGRSSNMGATARATTAPGRSSLSFAASSPSPTWPSRSWSYRPSTERQARCEQEHPPPWHYADSKIPAGPLADKCTTTSST